VFGKSICSRSVSQSSVADTVRMRLPGSQKNKLRERVCLFASYESSGRVAPYIINYLTALHAAGFDIVFIQSSDSEAAESHYDAIRPLCRLIINRTNVGHDFFSWKVGFAECVDIADYEYLLITNDSIIGPFTPLEPLVSAMQQDTSALWGLTDCSATGKRHVQSYFLFCHRQIFTSRFFERFWRDVTILDYKWLIVLRYEVGLSQAAQKAGVRVRAVYPYETVRDLCLQRGPLFQFSKELQTEPLNPTLHAWDVLIQEMKFPFIKTELLRDNRLALENLDSWRSLIAHAPEEIIEGATAYKDSWRWIIPERKEPHLPLPAAWGFLRNRNAQLYAHLCHRYDQLRRFARDIREGNSQEIRRKLRKSPRVQRLLHRFGGRRHNSTQGSAREVYFADARSGLSSFLQSSALLQLPVHAAPQVTIILILFNKAELTYRCLESLAKLRDEPPFHVIIVDNSSSDDTQVLLQRVVGATIVRNDDNRGFLRACNQAAALVATPHILFLNNDTILYPGALRAALEDLQDPSVGAVGGRIVLPDNQLQEAGSIFWNDGTCAGYGRGLPPEADECMHRRSVDYCSGVFLMTPAKLFREIGGFDELYAPAYYEEADYCAQLQSRGLQIVYDPRILVRHVEFGSAERSASAFALMNTNRVKFLEKNRALLATKCLPSTPHYRARAICNGRKRLLVLDDRVALKHLGAGYPRMNTLLHLLAEHRQFDITIGCTESFAGDWEAIRRDIPIDIEVLDLTNASRRERFLRERAAEFEVVWISRPTNMQHLLKVLPAEQLANRRFVLVYDSEAIFADRSRTEAEVFGLKRERAEAELKTELRNGSHADILVAVCESDARRWRSFTDKHVIVIGLDAQIAPGPRDFRSRRDILFTGSLHDVRSPNADALFWFMGEVMPIIRKQLPDVSVDAVGYVDKALEQRIGRNAANFSLIGRVPDLHPYFLNHRIMVAPTRFAAGIPQKVFDAAVTGLPTVCSPLIASQMQWTDGEETLIGSIQDPEYFAAQCIKLYTQQDTWEKVYDQSLQSMREYASHYNLARGVEELLAKIAQSMSKKAPDRAGTLDTQPLSQSAA
jgi:GT2 family glycosyltransferase/glycosyltransferase involved in cell wall biosynthesis